MKWSIPAKTFLLGEYAAVMEESAIVLTTSPCFELSLNHHAELSGIHPESPAGQLWQRKKQGDYGLSWFDPYQGRGGLGASSAQFIGAYLACSNSLHASPSADDLLNAYFEYAWNGEGLRPSGYDVLAQAKHGCVYINRRKHIIECYQWAFADIGFILLHSGKNWQLTTI